MTSEFVKHALALIKRIPRGRVATYGQIAALAGNPQGARQVVRLLYSLSDKEGLPWHRVINSNGQISLPSGRGFEQQRAMLADEGVQLDRNDRIDLRRFQWKPRSVS